MAAQHHAAQLDSTAAVTSALTGKVWAPPPLVTNKAVLQKLYFVLGSAFQAKCYRTVRTKIRFLPGVCADG